MTIKITIDGKKEEIKLSEELLHLKDKFIRLRELCVWYRKWAKDKSYSKGIYRNLQETPQWKEARKIQIDILRDLNHKYGKSYLRCSKCLRPTPEWRLVMHHKYYNWSYIFEEGIQIICRYCHDNL